MRRILQRLPSLLLAAVAGATAGYCPLAVRAVHAGEAAPATQNDPAAAKDESDTAVYCTLFLSEKLQKDVDITAQQRADLDKLHSRLKQIILTGASRAQGHGPARNKAGSLARVTAARLTVIGKEVKGVLTPEQDKKFTDFLASGKLRPIEVVAAEVHASTHPTGTSYGSISLVPHYNDPAKSGPVGGDSATQGTLRGNGAAGSYFRGSTGPGGSAAAAPEKPAKAQKPIKPETKDVDALLADLKAGHTEVLVRFLVLTPEKPNPEAARALEAVLADDSNIGRRIQASMALQKWGTRESIPPLEKAAESADRGVGSAARLAADVLLDKFDMAEGRMRTWHDNTDHYKIEAVLVRCADRTVTLKRADGKEVSMPLNRLSSVDRRFAERQAERKNNPNPFGT